MHRTFCLALLTTAPLAACIDAPHDPSDSLDDLEQADSVGGDGCTRGRMSVMGTPRNFGVAPGGPLAMSCTDGAWQVDEVFAGTGNVFSAGAFKFHDTGDWSSGTNWGDSPPYDGLAEAFGDGNDLVITEPGTYRLRFNDRTLRYSITRLPSSCASPSMFVRGSHNGWGTQEMFCVGENRWAAIVMFIGGAEQYKLDAHGDWSVNWGDDDRDGQGDRNGANIAAPGAGRYLITFDEASRHYEWRLVSAACRYPRMTVRGSFSGWQPIDMERENGHYALNVDGGDGAEMKFDARGDWSLNWGDNNGDLWGDRDGANIAIHGRHHVHFYNDHRYAYDRHD